MFEKMVDQVGRKLKILAKVVCYGGMAIAVAVGIVLMLGASLSNGGLGAAGGVLNSLLTVAEGCLIAWAAGLVIYAFGQLVEDVAASRACLESLRPREPAPAEEAPAEEAPSGYVPSNSRAKLDNANPEGWACRRCGARNSHDNRFCKACGEYR